ncbi:hypothetical protein DCS_01124 [Drechmeria coniospora]|uniref:glutathione-specific gamma-glutamylcyclotransferase n=1 Tax=Drechmeria coniospora TaxID=98403 RepID=A0A151GSD3_DRECN|nr:hypothetical protein DCS_01124 [Drechmeria coniospora]KYK59990.1 hypothetical protein DCS_01124 [Drechmeria coniospora]
MSLSPEDNAEFWLYGYGYAYIFPFAQHGHRHEKAAAYFAVQEPDMETATAFRFWQQYLDIREINGYSIHYAPFHPSDGSPPLTTLVYIGTPDNEQFVGPQDPQKLAEHILASRGPSGLNKEYLYNLDAALHELGPESGDVHISDLAARMRALERRALDQDPVTNKAGDADALELIHDVHFRQPTSTMEAEEIEKA